MDKSPETFKADFELGNGKHFVVEVNRAWSPNGADRFYELVNGGFFDDARFFRVVPNFMVQFGINGDPNVSAKWRSATIADDPVKESNKRGFVTFAKTGAPNSRTTQLFINFKDNGFLDGQGFAPFGRVISGMETVDAIYSGDGESPNQHSIQTQGNSYLSQSFPKLDYIKKAVITA
jgi:peptidyl-prolyl cis-trans isomerase A (cyclophilin A)